MKSNWPVRVVLLVLNVPAAVQAQFDYTTNADGDSVTITEYTGTGGVVSIPGALNGLLVTDIGTNAFEDSDITSVTIPASVNNIGVAAFYDCLSLTSINLGNGVTNIGDSAFLQCFHLANVTFGNGVTTIGSQAFEATGMSGVTIPGSVTSIGSDAFNSCNSLKGVTIPGSVTNIGDGAFAGCIELTEISVDPANLNYSSVSGVLFNRDKSILIAYPPGGTATSYAIPASVTNIGDAAFSFCGYLTSVSIPNGAISIGANAFDGSALTSITIPNSVIDIGTNAFGDCTSLTAINVATNNPAYSSEGGVLFNQSETTVIQYPPGNTAASYTILDSVTNIGDYAFQSCYDLASVTIGSGATAIGDSAFQYCFNLANITLGNSVITIGNAAFTGCPMSSLTIPNSVIAIGDEAFNSCSSLASLSIGNSVASIGDGAFYDCSSLASITIPSSVTNIGSEPFGFCSALTAINVETNNPAYVSAAGVLFNLSQTTLIQYPAQSGAASYVIPNSVTSIADDAFAYSSSLANVTIGDNVTNIGYYAFIECGLTSVAIPNSVTSLGIFAFKSCPSLTNATIGNGLTSIGDYAFALCDSLTSVSFTGNAPSVDSSVFFLSGNPTAYDLPGTTGWAQFSTETGLTTALWTLPYPLVLNGSLGVLNNQFAFTISWATNVPVVVEASADLSNPIWTPIVTNTLSADGTSSFSDPNWTNYAQRFYRLRAQ